MNENVSSITLLAYLKGASLVILFVDSIFKCKI